MKSAATQQAELAAVERGVKNVGAAWVLQGQTVAKVLEEEARRSGFMVTELGQGFIRLVSGVKDSAKAIHLLHDAEDVARARHLGLAQASVILARAAQGSDTALRRLGIIIPKLSENQAALKREHDAATASGVKFTASQQDSYKAALANAAALDKQASSQHVIAEIERRFGGQSARFAATSAGEFARLGENVHQLKVGIGEELLPTVNSLAEGVGREVEKMRESEGVHNAVADTVSALKAIFHDAKVVIETVAPPLEAVAHAAAEVVRAGGGANALIAFVVGFKAISIVGAAATAVETRYAAVVAAGARTEAGAAAASEAHTAAKVANTAAVAANTAAVVANDAALAAGTGLGLTNNLASIARGYNVATVGASGLVVATRNVEVGAATLGSRIGILGRGVFALSGGWVTLASVGLAAAAFGLFKVATADSATEAANKKLLTSLDELGQGFARESELARDYADSVSSIKSDRVALESAKASLALARQAAATTTAREGSVEWLSVQAQLAQALDSVRVSQRSLTQEEERAAQLRRQHVAEQERNLARQAAAVERVNKLTVTSFTESGRAPDNPQARAAKRFADTLEKDAARQRNASLRRDLEALATFARTAERLPTRREIKLALTAPSPKAAEAALANILAGMDRQAAQGGRAGGHAYADGFRAALGEGGGLFAPVLSAIGAVVKSAGKETSDAVRDSSRAARDAARATASAAHTSLKSLKGTIADARQTSRDASDAVVRAARGISDAEHGLAIAGRDVADAERGVAEAIKSGAQSVRDAVAQANQNLFSIGQSLSDTIGQFLDAKGKTETALTGPQARELARLRAQILAGQGGPETERAAQELAAKIEAAQHGGGEDGRKERIKRDIADLVDEFNKGAITLAQFNRRLAGVLAREGITYKNAGKTLGIAFADGFRAQVEGLQKQAAAIAAGPRQPGVTGLEPAIVRPLDALRESQKQIAAAQRARDDALYAKTIAIRDLADAQDQKQRALVEEAQAQRKLSALQERHQKLMQADARATRHLTSLVEQHTRYLADNAKAATAAAKRETAGAFPGAGPQRGGADLGHALGGGVAGGVRDEVNSVVAAIEALVAAALAAGRRKARASSPSRETQNLGHDLGLGLALGIDGARGEAGAAAESLIGHVLDRAGVAARGKTLIDDLHSHVRAIGELGKESDATRTGRDRELVDALRALGRMEERIGHESLAEGRRQTVTLERIHGVQKQPPRRERVPRRPGSDASDKARLAATNNWEG